MNNSIFHIVKREFGRFRKDRPMMWMFTLIPVLVFTIFALVYSKGLFYDIPVAVLDQDNTELSRTITRYVDASPNMKVVKHLTDPNEIKQGISKNEYYGVFTIPRGAETDIKKGKQANVGLQINCANMLVGKLLYRYGVTVISTVSGGVSVKQLKAAGKGDFLSYRMANPVAFSSKSLYNGTYNYLIYMVPGVIMVVMQMLIMFAGALSINGEMKKGTFGELVSFSKGRVLSIIGGKVLFYLLLANVILLFVFCILFPIFGIAAAGSLLNVFLMCQIFILASFMLGMFLSSLFPKPVMSLDFAFVYNSPAFLFSGFTFPIYGMPFYDQWYAKLVIFTYFQDAFFKLFQMDLPFMAAKAEMGAMIIFILVGFIGCLLALNYRVEQVKRNDGFHQEGVRA